MVTGDLIFWCMLNIFYVLDGGGVGGLPFLVELTPEGGDSRVVRLQMSVTGGSQNQINC